MGIQFGIDEDVLVYLRSQHVGKEKAVTGAYIKLSFGIDDTTLRQILYKLRTNGHPVCENASGYFYAQTADEINDTIQRLLRKSNNLNDATLGLVLSHQVFYDGWEAIPRDD